MAGKSSAQPPAHARHSALLAAQPELAHAFFAAGPQAAPFGLGEEVAAGAQRRRRAQLCAQLGLPAAGWTQVRQVHGRQVWWADGGPCQPPPAADAMITRRAGQSLAIRTADCVPVLAASGRLRLCAAAHAGWRGTAGGLMAQLMAQLAGAGAAASEVQVALGPAIGPCCFAVSPQVAQQLQAQDPQGQLGAHAPPPPTIDLWQLLSRQLLALGVLPAHLSVLRVCTCCCRRWASYRRDGAAAGRQVALIGWRPAAGA